MEVFFFFFFHIPSIRKILKLTGKFNKLTAVCFFSSHLELLFILDPRFLFLPLTYFGFMQFDQKVGQYHLTDTDIVITKNDFVGVTSSVKTVGSYAKFCKL